LIGLDLRDCAIPGCTTTWLDPSVPGRANRACLTEHAERVGRPDLDRPGAGRGPMPALPLKLLPP
jgi:hypothetical protein